MDPFSSWLKLNELDKYLSVLIENDVNTLALLSELSEDDLKELGFSLGDRKRFFLAQKTLSSDTLSAADEELIATLPYMIAYPLKDTLYQRDFEKRLYRLGYTFINFLKYLGLISISEFFNSDIKNRRIVDLFLAQLSEPSFGKWNAFIRESYAILKTEKIELVFPEFYDFYLQIEYKEKKFNISTEIIEDFGEVNYSKKKGLSSIGMLINFRNKYLGHGTSINDNQARELWEFYYPIFQTLLLKLSQLTEASLYKKENGLNWKLTSAKLTEEHELNSEIDESRVWLSDSKERKLSMIPFLIKPSDFGDDINESHLFVYESYTGKTLKFFSPESNVKETSGEILQRLNIILRDKQTEQPYSPEHFTKEVFLTRVAEENKFILDTLIAEKKVITGVYVHREEMEIKLREWIGARANIFFIAAEAGSGKTNLLVEIQKQYRERGLSSLLIRASRMEKQTLSAQLAYLLNIDEEKGLRQYSAITGTQAKPTFILIDGLNEASNSEKIWCEILDISKIFEPGSLKFVITSRATSKADIKRYSLREGEEHFMYGENKFERKGLSAFVLWLTPLNMVEMKTAWDEYLKKDKKRFKPFFTFDDLAEFDRSLYNQISNPLVLRLFLETYHGKKLPQKGNQHLNIWKDWLSTFSMEEQTFMELLAAEVWEKGENELMLDDLLKNGKLKSYFTSDLINSPYHRLKNLGWISRYVKELNSCICFTMEGALLHLLGLRLQKQQPALNLDSVQIVLNEGTRLRKASIEAFLNEQSRNGDLALTLSIIDNNLSGIDYCIPAVITYLKYHSIENTFEKILDDFTTNDIVFIQRVLRKLQEDDKKEHLSKLILEMFNWSLKTNNECFITTFINYFDYLENSSQEILINYLNNEDGRSDVAINIVKSKYYSKTEDYRSAYHVLNNDIKNVKNYEVLQAFELIRQRAFVSGRIFQKDINMPVDNKYFEEVNDLFEIIIPKLKESEMNIYLSHIYEDKGFIFSLSGKRLALRGDPDNCRNKYEKAKYFYNLAKNIRIKEVGERHSLIADLLNKYAFIEKELNNIFSAEKFLIESTEIRELTKGKNDSFTATNYFNLGDIYELKNDHNKAILYYSKSLVIREKDLWSHSEIQRCYNSLGRCYEKISNHEDALAFFVSSAERGKVRNNVNDSYTIQAISNAKRLAKELNKENELPEWMKEQ